MGKDGESGDDRDVGCKEEQIIDTERWGIADYKEDNSNTQHSCGCEQQADTDERPSPAFSSFEQAAPLDEEQPSEHGPEEHTYEASCIRDFSVADKSDQSASRQEREHGERSRAEPGLSCAIAGFGARSYSHWYVSARMEKN
jgi:hypothetical protein